MASEWADRGQQGIPCRSTLVHDVEPVLAFVQEFSGMKTCDQKMITFQEKPENPNLNNRFGYLDLPYIRRRRMQRLKEPSLGKNASGLVSPNSPA